jgi:hypothetical protein
MHGPKCKLGSSCTVGKRLQEINILGGLILPVWGVIEKALAKQVFSVLFTLLLPLGTSSCQSVISNVVSGNGWCFNNCKVFNVNASLIANYFSDIMK